MRPAGALALVVLSVALPVAAAAGCLFKRCMRCPSSAAHAVATITFALPFWAWAGWHTATGTFDLGVVSFASVVAASVAQLCTPQARAQTWLTLAGNAFVAVNYAVPLLAAALGLVNLKPLLFTYFALATVIWSANGAAGFALLAFRKREAPLLLDPGVDAA